VMDGRSGGFLLRGGGGDESTVGGARGVGRKRGRDRHTHRGKIREPAGGVGGAEALWVAGRFADVAGAGRRFRHGAGGGDTGRTGQDATGIPDAGGGGAERGIAQGTGGA